jgi:hypothetical protein
MSIFDLEGLIEKVISKLDVEAIAADVMSKMKIQKLELYFVVGQQHDQEGYEFAGMAYSSAAAYEIMEQAKGFYSMDVLTLRIDMGRLLDELVRMGVAEEVRL